MNQQPTVSIPDELAAASMEAPMKLDPTAETTVRGTVADLLEVKGTVIHAIGPGDTVHEALVKLNACQIGALLVMDGPKLVGIISERDYTRKGILAGRTSTETRVDEIMSSKVVTVGLDTSLGQCMHIVTERSIRHLPVVQDGQVVGVLSIGDLVSAVVSQQAEIINSLKTFIGSDYPS
jgi:CBS domain-containing protein